MGRRKKYTDEGASLFDTATPLSLPKYSDEEVIRRQDFINDSKYTLGMVVKISRELTDKVVAGESPNHALSKFITDMMMTIKYAMASYGELSKLENEAQNLDSKIHIEFKKEELK